MKNFVKFLEDGEYHYATVKDLGDIDQLVTSNKADVVSAINELITKLVGGSSEYDNLDKTIQDKLKQVADEAADKIDQVKQDATDKIGQTQQMTASEIADLQVSTQYEIDDAVAKAKESIDNANKSIEDANKTIAATQDELQSVREKFNSDNDTLNLALKDLQKETENTIKEANDKIKVHDDNIKTINDKADSLTEDLDQTKKDLSTVTKDLEDTQLGVTKVDKKVDDVKGELEYKVTQEALDNVQGQVTKNANDIKVNKEGLEVKADKASVDTLTQDVDKMNGTLQIHSNKISQMVTRESLINDLDNLDIKSDNLLTGSREFFDWTISNNAKIHVTNEKFRECKWASITGAGEFISINVDDLVVGATYTLSVGAKTIKDGGIVQVIAKNVGTLQDITKNTNITTTPTQYTISFVADNTTMIIGLGMTGSLSDGNELYVNQPKLEKGMNATGWSVNVNDNYTRVEKVEARQIVQDGQITDMVQKQRDFGDMQTKDETSISVLSDKLQINSDNITKIDQKVTDTNTKIDLTAGALEANFSQEVNQKIGEISDSSNNQILNSAFTKQFNKWQAVSAKAKITKIQDSNWAEFQQSGSANDASIAIQSNYFPVKDKDTVTVAFDFLKKSDIALDNMTIILLEIFDIKDTRVDFKALSVNEFGKNIIQDTTMRLTYKYNVNHTDAKKMTIKPILYRNGHILFTKFFTKVSTISNGEYTPNPEDMQEIISTQQLAIDANTNGLTAKADKTSVDSLTQTVTDHSSSINLLNDQMAQKTTKTDFDKLTGRVNTAEQKITANSDGVTSAVSKINGVRDDLDNMKIGGTNLLTGTQEVLTVNGANISNQVPSKRYVFTFDNLKNLNLSVGDNYTLSFDWNIFGDTISGSFYAQLNGTPWDSFGTTNLSGSNKSGHFVRTIQANSAWLTSVSTAIQVRMDNLQGSLSISHMKFEKGNVATDYSPAPEDQATVTALNVVKQTADKTYEGLFDSDGSNKIEKTAQGMTAQISTAKNDLKNYTDGAVSGLEIGGSNLLYGTRDFNSKYWVAAQDASMGSDGHADVSGFSVVHAYKDWASYRNNQTITFEKGVPYTVSACIKGLSEGDMGITLYCNGVSGSNYSVGGNDLTKHVTSVFKRYSVTIIGDGNTYSTLRIEPHGTWNNVSGSVYFYALKLEKGNVATDYSDTIQDAKDYANTTISAKAGELTAQLTSTTTTLKTYADSSATNAKNAAISTAASDATTKANSAKSQAVSTASSDATTKANNAQNNAISQSKTYADTTITAKAGELTAKITSVQKNVDNLKTGASNILRSTSMSNNKHNMGGNVGSGVTTNIEIQSQPDSPSGYTMKLSRTDSTTNSGGRFWGTPHKLLNGLPYAWTVIARGVGTWTIGDEQGGLMSCSLTSTTTWATFNHSFTANDNQYNQFIFYTTTKNAWIEFFPIMLVQGNTPSNWAPAPEDLNEYAETILSAKAGELTAKLSSNTTDLKTYADNSATTKANGALSNAKTYADTSATNAKNSAISTASSDATTKANNAQNTAKSYAETILNAKAGQLTAATNAADYRNLFSMNSSGILLDAHGVNNSNKSIILSSDHVVIDSSKPVSIPAASIKGTLSASILKGGIINTDLLQLQGKDSYMSLDSSGLIIGGNDAKNPWQTFIKNSNLGFTTNYNGSIEAMGGMQVTHKQGNAADNGLFWYLLPQQILGSGYGGDELSMGYVNNVSKNTLTADMIYSATGYTKRAGFHFYNKPIMVSDGVELQFVNDGTTGNGGKDTGFIRANTNYQLTLGTWRGDIALMPDGAHANILAGNKQVLKNKFEDAFCVGDDGAGRIWSNCIWNRVYSDGANGALVMTAYGTIGVKRSASKYKLNISEIPTLDEDAHNFLSVKPKQWYDKQQTEDFADELTNGSAQSADHPKVEPTTGFIAEDLQTAGLDNYTIKGKDGSLEGLHYDRLPVLHHELIKELFSRLDQAEMKIMQLEERLTNEGK